MNGIISHVLVNSGQEAELPNFKYLGSISDGDCGVWAKTVSLAEDGPWTLEAINASSYGISGRADITVKPEDVAVYRETELVLGTSATIVIGPSQGIYFQAIDPKGFVYNLQSMYYIIISPVTLHHEGNWTLMYGIKGKTSEIKEHVFFTVKDVPEQRGVLQASVKPSSRISGGQDLLCKLKTSSQQNFCRFIRPDGTGLFMNEGIGNSDYSYYDGNLDGNEVHCGATIHNPGPVDYGMWECIISLTSSTVGTFFEVTPPSRAGSYISITPVPEYVVALQHTNMQLKCHVNHTLTACWFHHPNGSIMSPPFDGRSLSQGNCEISIENVTEAQSGEWTCSGAIIDNPKGDLHTPIHVLVTDNMLSVLKSVVEVSSEESATLQCHSSFPQIPLQNCHFIRPDGVGITFSGQNSSTTILDNYSYRGAGLLQGECGITIKSAGDTDFGTWICAAVVGLPIDYSFMPEYKVAITLESNDLTVGAIVGIAVGCAAVLLVAIGGFIAYRKFKK